MVSDLIELFSIGTELTLGQIQDTNAHWIAQQVFRLGGTVRRVTILRDNADEMRQAFSESIRRDTGLILMTGGLGPTPDDMTAQIVAGLDGIERKLVPPQPTDTPYDEREAVSLPRNIIEAVTALRADEFFRDKLGPQFVEYFLHIKDEEIARFLSTVTDWEQAEYFEMF